LRTAFASPGFARSTRIWFAAHTVAHVLHAFLHTHYCLRCLPAPHIAHTHATSTVRFTHTRFVRTLQPGSCYTPPHLVLTTTRCTYTRGSAHSGLLPVFLRPAARLPHAPLPRSPATLGSYRYLRCLRLLLPAVPSFTCCGSVPRAHWFCLHATWFWLLHRLHYACIFTAPATTRARCVHRWLPFTARAFSWHTVLVPPLPDTTDTVAAWRLSHMGRPLWFTAPAIRCY